MWELDHKEGWKLKDWCFWTVMLEKTLESPLDYKEIQLVHPKGNQSEYPLKGLMLKLKLQYFGHLIWRKELGKARDAGKGDNRGWDGWMASLTQWTWVWVSSGSWWWTGSLACYSPRGHKELASIFFSFPILFIHMSLMLFPSRVRTLWEAGNSTKRMET